MLWLVNARVNGLYSTKATHPIKARQ